MGVSRSGIILDDMTTSNKPARILVLSGSTRSESFNKKLAAAAAQVLQTQANDVALIDLSEFDAPIYNGDDEAQNGLPASMQALKKIFAGAEAVVISCPEYNGFIPPLLVNTFSWLSRPENGEKSVALSGKMAAIMATSPGLLGGIRVMPRLRDCLSELGMTVLPGYVTVKSAFDAFGDSGELVNEADAQALTDHMAKLRAALGG